MPVHSLIFMNMGGNIIYSKYFLDTALQDYNTRLFFEQRLFKAVAPMRSRISSTPSSVTISDVVVMFQTIGDLIMFVSGVGDVDESLLKDILGTIEKILFEVLDSKITESQFLVSENYGKFVVSVDDMMPQGIVETLDAALVGRLSKLKTAVA